MARWLVQDQKTLGSSHLVGKGEMAADSQSNELSSPKSTVPAVPSLFNQFANVLELWLFYYQIV